MPTTYTQLGKHQYRRDVPASALQKDFVNVDFSLDKYLQPQETEGRELGVVVSLVGLEAK